MPSELGDWLLGVAIGSRVQQEGQLEAALPTGEFRMAQVSLDFGVSERQGQIMLAFCVPPKPEVEHADDTSFGAAFAARLRQEPITVEAVLHRFTTDTAAVSAFKVGTVIPLDGASLSRVAVFAVGSSEVLANARLGKINGMKAIRIEAALTPEMDKLDISVSKTEGPPARMALEQDRAEAST